MDVSSIATVAAVLLGLAFLVAGGSKIAAGDRWPVQAGGLGAPTFVVPVLPWIEIVVGALLVVQVARRVVATLALLLLVAFTVLIVRLLARGQRPPCACFGAWSVKPLGAGHVWRNAGLGALGVAALL